MIVPGAGYGGYFQLKKIVEEGILRAQKISFELKGNLVYVNGKALQGLVVFDNHARITGIHYTSWEAATQIRSMMRIEPSLEDPFVYISEPGAMKGWPEELIKKELGAAAANTEVKLIVVIPIDRVWIKASRNVVHYAIAGILSREEILELHIQRRKSQSAA
ncbi:MAG: hypothetical protein QXT19_04015 [Candidatus Woesearchaeota archaeon]